MKYFYNYIYNVKYNYSQLQVYKMSEFNNNECPICMDDIDITKNCITTECGHRFHASCLMTNVSHNGFNCPYCRTGMAEEIEVNNGNDDDESIYDDMELYDDYSLRGLRLFTNNINNERHDDTDLLEEQEYVEYMEFDTNSQIDESIPTSAVVMEKLIGFGILYEDLVKVLLTTYEEYNNVSDYDRISNTMYGAFRRIISNHKLDYSRTNPVINIQTEEIQADIE